MQQDCNVVDLKQISIYSPKQGSTSEIEMLDSNKSSSTSDYVPSNMDYEYEYDYMPTNTKTIHEQEIQVDKILCIEPVVSTAST